MSYDPFTWYYLEAPGMYIGAHAVIRAIDETAARKMFRFLLLQRGCLIDACRPMTCREIKDTNADANGVLAFMNGEY